MTRQYEEYDVIIVGGGLAGLSAACELSGRTLLLETDDRLGGKVRTENRNGIVCETGAIFAFEPRWFDFPVNAGFHYENDYPVGLFHRGRLHIGDSAADCLRSLNPEPRRQLCLPMFIASPNPQEAMIGEDLTLAMKAFFRVIHPGTPTEAVPTRRRDCFVRHRADHFERGNGAMVEAMAANCGAEIRTGCRGLVDAFFDREEGGFRTLPSGRMGRAPYWRGVDCPATAFCAWLLTQIDPARYAEEITLCRDYLLRNQRVSGGWPGKWFPSQTIPIWYTLRFFASLEDLSRDFSLPKGVRERAVYRLQSGQGDDGSWGGSVIETSAALLALAAASPDSPSLGLGRDWLRRVKGPDGWVGEPILAYWFEEKGERTLYFTRDLGRVSSAWATLALAGEKEKSV